MHSNLLVRAERARREGAPEIILDAFGRLEPRVHGGVDRGRKTDIANLEDVPEIVDPAWVLFRNELHQPAPEESRDAWLARVRELIDALDDDQWIGVYDVHF